MAYTCMNESDPALDVLQRRIFDAGMKKEIITYADFVENVAFNPKSPGAKCFITEMHAMNVALMGEYLDYISSRSYARFGFLPVLWWSAKSTKSPAPDFTPWLKN